MGDTTINWTDKVWNPVRGCLRVSPGCGGAAGEGGCYAERFAGRFSGPGLPYEGLVRLGKQGARWTGVVRFVPEMLDVPLRWRKPQRIFVNSMSDLFHEGLTNEQIAAVFGVMAAAPRHTFQVLTKRPLRMREWFRWVGELGPTSARSACRASASLILGPPVEREPFGATWPLPNVWLGVTAEDQLRLDERVPLLLDTPAAVRWVSAEPLLGPLDASNYMPPGRGAGCEGCRPGLDWVVVGGESGPGARPCALEWIEDVVDQCLVADVPCWVKQLGACVVSEERTADAETQAALGMRSKWAWQAGLRDRAGADIEEFPAGLCVREMPGAVDLGEREAARIARHHEPGELPW